MPTGVSPSASGSGNTGERGLSTHHKHSARPPESLSNASKKKSSERRSRGTYEKIYPPAAASALATSDTPPWHPRGFAQNSCSALWGRSPSLWAMEQTPKHLHAVQKSAPTLVTLMCPATTKTLPGRCQDLRKTNN